MPREEMKKEPPGVGVLGFRGSKGGRRAGRKAAPLLVSAPVSCLPLYLDRCRILRRLRFRRLRERGRKVGGIRGEVGEGGES